MEFTASQITLLTGVKRTRLQQWLEKEYLSPSIRKAYGHGTRNIYSIVDAYCIALFKKITESGLSRRYAADILDKSRFEFTEKMFDYAEHILYIREGRKTSVRLVAQSDIQTGFPMSDVMPANYDDALIINFKKIKAEIDESVSNLSS